MRCSATESDSSASEQAGVTGNLKVPTVFRAVGIVATAIGGCCCPVSIQCHADATGTGNELLTVLKLHKFRV